MTEHNTGHDTGHPGNGSAEVATESVTPSMTYTRTGDSGSTTLGDESRTGKGDLRVVAYGECEEADAAVGMVIALAAGLPDDVVVLLARVQNDLVDVCADLSTPVDRQSATPALRVDAGYVERVERACDHFNAELPSLPSFAIPGGTASAALLHHARTVVRRAERAVHVALEHLGESVNPITAGYLNRLSSLLFILARGANAEHGDTLWHPGFSAQLGGVELWELPTPEGTATA